MSGQAVFVQILFLLQSPPNIQISTFNTHFHTLDDRSRQSISWHHVALDVHHIYSETFTKISIYSLKMGVWNDLDEKHLQHKIKRGPSKSPPNSFQIGNLEGDIWTFEQIDELWQSPIYSTKLIEALPNRRQICSKSEIWKAIFEHLNRYMNYGSHPVWPPFT
jgi:hypothetical protein